MNRIIKSSCAILLSLLLGACSENDSPKPVTQPTDDADIDFTEENAGSWTNYMLQVASLLEQDAKALYDAWTVSYEGGECFANQFRDHTGSDYPSAMACIEQIIDGCADIANEVGTSKIGDPYNLFMSGDTQRALYAVESWYSWHSRDDYTNNIRSIRNAFNGSRDKSVAENSISALLKELNPQLQSQLENAIREAENAIQSIPQPFRNNINSNESRKAMEACADLEQLLSNNLKSAIATVNDNDQRLQFIVENYIDNVVIPTYSDLSTLNHNLYLTINELSKNPTSSAFEKACAAWISAREPWETSEAFLFGPVDALGLDPNMDSWPLDQESIVRILNSGKFDNLDWTDSDTDDAIEAKQGVRGFHTLEFLLFKNGNPRKGL